jgi:hypothetical protein
MVEITLSFGRRKKNRNITKGIEINPTRGIRTNSEPYSRAKATKAAMKHIKKRIHATFKRTFDNIFFRTILYIKYKNRITVTARKHHAYTLLSNVAILNKPYTTAATIHASDKTKKKTTIIRFKISTVLCKLLSNTGVPISFGPQLLLIKHQERDLIILT